MPNQEGGLIWVVRVRTIRSISSSDSLPFSALMVICSLLPVRFSFADTYARSFRTNVREAERDGAERAAPAHGQAGSGSRRGVAHFRALTGAAAGGLPQPIHAAAPKSNKHKPSRTVLAASTCSMPLASTLNVTSICGIPRGIGGIPFRSNLPRMLLSFVNRRSPSYTCHVAANQGMRQSINQQSIKQQNQLPRTPGWLWLCSRLARGAGSGGHARRPGCSHQAGCRRTSRMSATCAQVSSCHVESGWSSDRPPFRCRGRADLHRVGVGPLCPPTPRPTAHPPNE